MAAEVISFTRFSLNPPHPFFLSLALTFSLPLSHPLLSHSLSPLLPHRFLLFSLTSFSLTMSLTFYFFLSYLLLLSLTCFSLTITPSLSPLLFFCSLSFALFLSLHSLTVCHLFSLTVSHPFSLTLFDIAILSPASRSPSFASSLSAHSFHCLLSLPSSHFFFSLSFFRLWFLVCSSLKALTLSLSLTHLPLIVSCPFSLNLPDLFLSP